MLKLHDISRSVAAADKRSENTYSPQHVLDGGFHQLGPHAGGVELLALAFDRVEHEAVPEFGHHLGRQCGYSRRLVDTGRRGIN